MFIHNVKQDGNFPINNQDCTIIPRENDNIKQVHLGHINNHYFLIKGEQGLQELMNLRYEDFDNILSKDDYYSENLNTTIPR